MGLMLTSLGYSSKMVRDEPRLLDDGKRYPNLKEEVDGLIPSHEISSMLDRKLAR
jgi:hypothetical protein